MPLSTLIPRTTLSFVAELAVTRRSQAALASVVALASVLRLYDLGQGHPGLAIYSAISKNTTTSFHNWLYPSIFVDGSVLADKPPVFFWIQGTFIALLGPTNVALRLPAALAGIASVVVVYAIVRRCHGSFAGLAAALMLAVMPLDVNFSRGVFLEPVATLTMLVAAYLVVRAVQERREGFYYAAAAVIGLAFMVKLWQGLLPVPAFALMALLYRWTPWPRLVRTGAICAAIFLASAFWWPTLMWLTSGSYEAVMNSANVWDMIFGWNLQERFGGLEYGGANYRQDFSWSVTGPMAVFLGISLIPGALLGVLALAGRRASGLGVLWLTWLAVGMVGFGGTSVKLASYWASVTPAVAALSGIGLAFLVENRARSGRLWLALLLLAAAGFAYQANAFWRVREVAGYFEYSALAAGATAAAMIMFAGPRVVQDPASELRDRRGWTPSIVLSAVGLAIVLLNGQMAVHNILSPRTDTLGRIGFDMIAVPSAEPAPSVTSSRGRLQGAVITSIVRVETEDLDAALEFVRERRGDSRYLLAADTYNTSARVSLLTGEPVLTLYSEYQDTRVTDIPTLEALVEAGDVRFVLTSNLMWSMDFDLLLWVAAHSRDVSNRAGLPRGEMVLLQIAR